jgi:hypothetical protein
MAADALAAGYAELLWVDPELGFRAEDVERLRRHAQLFVGGLPPPSPTRPRPVVPLPGSGGLDAREPDGFLEVRYLAFGLVLTRRALFEQVRARLGLPLCDDGTGRGLVPWFTPMVVRAQGDAVESSYLCRDFAFCERVRRAGVPVYADPVVRLRPIERGDRDAAAGSMGGHTRVYVTANSPKPTMPAAQETRPARPTPHRPARLLGPSFPRLRAYCVSYRANRKSLRLTLEDFGRCDWGEPILVFVQPDDWPPGKPSASRNYRRVLEHAYADGCDFALVLEDDVRVNRWLRHNLTANPLVRRDQCDYLSLFMPDLIASPWQRQERHLGYRLARPLYSGPNQTWERHRVWGSQGYLLSRRFLMAALERWDRLNEGQDTRVISVCSELGLPLWYTYPCLLEHAPLTSAFGTPPAYAPDFDREFRLEPGPGFQPPEGVPGRLDRDEAELLWREAGGRSVLELGTAYGRATVCLAQQARRVVTVGTRDQAEAREWARRYGVLDRIAFLAGEPGQFVPAPGVRFEFVFVGSGFEDARELGRRVEAAAAAVQPGGLVAVIDYPDPCRPEVREVVDAHACRLGWRRTAQVNFLAVFRTPDQAP